MKFSKSIFILALTGISLVSCKKEENTTNEIVKTEAATPKKEIAAANLESATFNIEGMTCAMGCAATIEKKLIETNGVKEAKVDFDTKTATVSFDKTVNNQKSLTKLVEAVADGKTYKVTNFKLSI